MPRSDIDDTTLLQMIESLGVAETARRTGTTVRNVYKRRIKIEKNIKRQITVPDTQFRTRFNIEHPGRINVELQDGVCLIGSDCHYWPGAPSLMHRAFVSFCKEMKPKIVILNGDVLDLGGISRHPPIGWTRLPKVEEEIANAQERLSEIEKATHRARKIWGLGNHDGRFETRLATVAQEFARVHGTKLTDHFPLWEPCWSVFINNAVVVKHDFKGGIHATHNNTLWAGLTMVTGHLHSQKVTPLTDYNGVRWGVDAGCIADPDHRAFVDYTRDSPKNWRDGFCVLTFKGGRLLPPELVSRWDVDHVVFRGEIICVAKV